MPVSAIFAALAALLLGTAVNNRWITILLLLSLFYLASARIGEGADYYSYLNMYESVNENPLLEWREEFGLYQNVELVFKLFMSAAKYMGLDFQSFITICAAISIYFLGRMVYEFSDRPNLSLLIYFGGFFFFWPYSGIRLALVLSVVGYYFCRYICDKKVLKIITIICLMSFLHTSALAYLLLIPFAIKKYNRKKYLLTLSIIIISAIVISQHFLDIIQNFNIYERIHFYVNSQEDISSFKIIARGLIFSSALISYIILYEKLSDFTVILYQVFLTLLPIYIGFSSVSIIAEQISLFSYLYITIVPVNTLRVIQRRYLKKLLFLTIAIFSIHYFYITYTYTLDASARNL